MSADLLREAAALMREQAQAATPGPWKMWNGWGPTHDGLMGVERFGPEDGRVFTHDDQRDLYATAGDWEHIASWHPAVALAVADLLDCLAAGIELSWGGSPEADLPKPYRHALAVARAYLGRDA